MIMSRPAGSPLSVFTATAARRFGDRICLVDGERRFSFATFDALVDRIASGLARRFAPGTRVALLMANRAEYLLLQFALERAALVRVPINARAPVPEVRHLLSDSGAAALFLDTTTAARADAAAIDLGPLWRVNVQRPDADWRDLIEHTVEPELLHRAALDDLCSLNYTSGSSGIPKGVMLTHRNWFAVARNMLVDRDLRADDRVAHVGPLSHASGSYFTPWFLRGACAILVPGGQAGTLIETIERERVTVFTCVPTVLTRIVNHPAVETADLTSLRAVGYGAEPIPLNTLRKALARFGPILTQNYGQTEAYMTIALLTPDEHFDHDGLLRIGCVGRPYSFVEAVLRAPDGSPVPQGETGEITVRSDHVMAGYWNLPEATATALRDGWLWSGDLARADRDGRLTLVGRSKDMLISGGFNIYPQEIETVLTAHAEIIEAAVIGVPDPDWGEAAVAFVAPAPAARIDANALGSYCQPLLGFRTPKRFVFVEELPKTSSGKADKTALRRQFESEVDAHD